MGVSFSRPSNFFASDASLRAIGVYGAARRGGVLGLRRQPFWRSQGIAVLEALGVLATLVAFEDA